MLARSLVPALAIAGCLGCGGLLTASSARADDGVGAFRIALSTDLVGYARRTLPEAELPIGTLAEVRADGVFVGLLTPRLGLDLSGVIDPLIVLGVTTALHYDEVWLDEHRSEGVVRWMASAWLELVLLPGDVARPFVRGSLGISGADRWGPDGDELQSRLALSAGAHLFASEDVSIDPFVSLLYRAGEATGTTSTGERVSRPVEDFEIALGISLSAWLGGRPAEPATPTEPAEPATSARSDEAR